MKNIHQIQVVNKALESEKNKYLTELSKTNQHINKKSQLVKQLANYLKEYASDNNLLISRKTPRLFSNLNHFMIQIEKTIHNTDIEIQRLINSRKLILDRIQKVDQKIKLMELFEKNHANQKLMNERKIEQREIDDIAVTKKIGSEYD